MCYNCFYYISKRSKLITFDIKNARRKSSQNIHKKTARLLEWQLSGENKTLLANKKLREEE